MTDDCDSVTKTLKLMTERYKKILSQKVKVSAKINKCHQKKLIYFSVQK